MYEFKPITVDNGVIQIHPLRATDALRHDEMVSDLLEIFSNVELKKYNPEKYLVDKKKIGDHLFGVVISYHQQLGYTHYLTWMESGKVIGQIDILTPKRVEDLYPVKDTWFIEYYLNADFWNRGIMSGAVEAVISNMKRQGIKNIGAVCMPENIGSIAVLERSGFIKMGRFDAKQDYYQVH